MTCRIFLWQRKTGGEKTHLPVDETTGRDTNQVQKVSVCSRNYRRMWRSSAGRNSTSFPAESDKKACRKNRENKNSLAPSFFGPFDMAGEGVRHRPCSVLAYWTSNLRVVYISMKAKSREKIPGPFSFLSFPRTRESMCVCIVGGFPRSRE